MKNRKESAARIKAAFKELTGYDLHISPSKESYDHVIMVSMKSETPEQAARAIYDSERI